MKLLLFASAANRHTHRWTTWLADEGHDVSFISDVPPRPDLDFGPVRIHRPRWTLLRNLYVFKIRGGPFANNWHKWRVYREIIEREKPDVINAYEALVNGPTLVHFPHYPRVLTPWGPDIEEMTEYADREEGALIRQGMHAADLITCNAVGLEEHWERLTGVPRSKYRFFSWGTDIRLFRPRSAEEGAAARAKFNLGQGPILLSPRMAQRYYQLDLLMKTWTSARQREDAGPLLRTSRLVILRAGGNQQDWNELLTLHRTLNDDTIQMLDARLEPQEMAAFYSLSSGVVMLPKTDLLSMSLIESIACGALPIALRQPQNESVIEEPGGAGTKAIGFLCSEETLEDALLRWSKVSEEEAARFSDHNALYAAREHDWNVCGKRTVEVYREAIEGKAKGGV